MATGSDYDARRGSDADRADQSGLRELAPGLTRSSTAVVDEDPNDASCFELPGADLSGEELAMKVVPKRADEFTCSSCFLVQHRSRLRISSAGRQVCADCV
ncbi:DUF4193 domain-containing protein [Mycobacterium decipiens]|uniref:Cytochrome n=1 Tax=Mycobacterium decipiens TaxID=1430326 RepID=A0A1X2LTI0_9MYCO|nr:DUF4193 domain-containing protein [Mycobacterium decipiens]OSC40190.1 cytochrome [Mycobacterium decipiens]